MSSKATLARSPRTRSADSARRSRGSIEIADAGAWMSSARFPCFSVRRLRDRGRCDGEPRRSDTHLVDSPVEGCGGRPNSVDGRAAAGAGRCGRLRRPLPAACDVPAEARVGCRRLTAETFARAWMSRRRFRNQRDGSALPWLFGIAHNVLRESAQRDGIETRLVQSLVSRSTSPPRTATPTWSTAPYRRARRVGSRLNGRSPSPKNRPPDSLSAERVRGQRQMGPRPHRASPATHPLSGMTVG